MKIAFSVLLLIHAFAHLVGFVVPWGLVQLEDMPYRTTLLAGRLDVGHGGIRAMGILWLLSAIAFVGSAATLLVETEWWSQLLFWAVVFSFVLCLLGWPDSRFGLVINLLVLVLLLIGTRSGWLPGAPPDLPM
jgi:hypothetical protein